MKDETKFQVLAISLIVVGMVVGIAIGQGLTIANAKIVNENCIEYFGKPHYYVD